MVRPSQERQTLVLTDAQSVSIGTGTSVGDDDVDYDGGETNPDAGPATPPVTQTVKVIADSSTWDKVLDFAQSSIWDITLGANLTGIVFDNPPPAGIDAKMEVTYRQPLSGGPYTLDQPAEADWQDTDGTGGGPEPTMPTAAESVLVVVFDVRDGGTSYGGTYDSVVSPPAPGTLPWFNVVDYGATGDGSTDDLTAVNDAIADLNAAGAGVLYFPASDDAYYTSAGFDAITVPCTIMGDGGGEAAASVIETDDASDVLFTITADGVRITGLKLLNSNGSESSGAAIATTTGFGKHNRYDHLWVEGFYDGLSLVYGWEWTLTDFHVTNPVRYGINIASQDLADAGDWAIDNGWVGTRSRNATTAIRQFSAGGGKISNVKINQNSSADQGTFGGTKRFVTGIHANISSATTILMVHGVSIENVSGDAVLADGDFGYIDIVGLQVGLYGNNTGRAVKLGASIHNSIIDDLIAKTDGTARAAVELTSTTNITLGTFVLVGFNARYTASGDSGTVDGTSPGSLQLDDLTDVVISSPTTGDVLTYDGADWVNEQPAPSGGSSGGFLLLSDDHASPIIFDDILQADDFSDLLYSEA